MHVIDMRRRLDYLVETYPDATDPDQRSRIKDQIRNYRDKIKRAELEQHLGSLEFEVRFETDPVEKDYVADDRDAAKHELAAMDCDGDIDGKASRGLICGVCKEIVEQGEVMRENGKGVSVACHPDCHFHTCEGMIPQKPG